MDQTLPPPSDPAPHPAPLTITADMLAAPEPAETRVDFERGISVLPRLALALIAVNVAVFLWESASGALATTGSITAAGALHRDSVLAGQVWRIPWSMFLHADVAHLAGNCVVLYILGMGLEHAAGSLAAAATYAFAGVCGALLSLAMQPGPAVGASGAIFGLAGALVVFLARFRNVYFVRDKRIAYVLLAWAVFQIVAGSLDPRIDNFAHLGGLTGGAIAAIALRPRIPPPTCGFTIHPRP